MLLSKANLALVKGASTDKEYSNLNCLFIHNDGTTVACDRFSVIACSPIVDDGFYPIPKNERIEELTGQGVSLPTESVDKIVKAMPKSKANTQQYIALTKLEDGRLEVSIADRRNKQTISVITLAEKFIDWMYLFKLAYMKLKKYFKQKGPKRRVCLHRSHLLQMLQILDESCGKGVSPLVMVEFGAEDEPVILRGQNPQTNQRLLGVLRPVYLKNNWVDYDEWELEILKSNSIEVESEGEGEEKAPPKKKKPKKKKPLPKKNPNI